MELNSSKPMAMDRNDPMLKREIFAVSLRKERKRVILDMKRYKLTLTR